MASTEVLRRAIQAARGGRKAEARDLLIKLVEVEPQNELAWMWLSGLVDSLEDRIIACENVLTINPANERVRSYLQQLKQRRKTSLEGQNREAARSLLDQAKAHAERNEMDVALDLARQALEKYPSYEEAWLLVGKLSSPVDKQIEAFEQAYQINPLNKETVLALEELRYLKANPLSAARHLEQMGRLDEALKTYQELAAKTKASKEFDYIYKQIIRIEGLQNEKIHYVAPSSSILRLTFVWPLLYMSLALVQMGLNPLTHSRLYMWLGLPFVVLGSFLLSLTEVRSAHGLWKRLFDEQGDGSQFARWVTATAGWFFVILPHVLLAFDSLNRLRNFVIPPMPF